MLARARDARRDLAAAFRRRRQDEIGGGHGRHLDVQIDAVEQRARQPRLVVRGAARVGPALAGEARLVGAAAAAGVHGGDQHEARRIGDAMVGARDRDFAGLERLAQRIEHLRLELRQFVEKQHAVMRERDFARPRAQAAADQRRHRGGMMRRCGTAAGWSARRLRSRPRPRRSSRLPAVRPASAAAGWWAAAPPASICRRRAGRPSAGCGRRRRRPRARAWRSPGP